MRILLDTNIFIYREDDHVIPEELKELLMVLNKTKTEILIHPLSIEELKKDKDERRREIILSKVESYPILESPPDPENDIEFNRMVKGKKENDFIDNALLFSVYRNAVDFLITEDMGLHKKARYVGIDDRVLLIADALKIFREQITHRTPTSLPSLREDFVYNLDLKDPIFDKLKRDYEEFEHWFTKIQKEGRKCWVHRREDGSMGALLIYKIEDEAVECTPPLPKKKRLKISTFIVTNVGKKIGELFIKLSVDFCLRNGIDEMYLTHYTEPNDRLIQLITEYGFRKVCDNARGEEVYLKRLKPDPSEIKGMEPKEIVNNYYPTFYDGIKVKKYVVPIQPKFHERLFTERDRRQTTLPEYRGEFIIEGNTIKKAYLTNSKITKIKEGDVILFYRSKDRSKITSIGVVESVYTRITDTDEVMRIVGKRTVYSRDEIENITQKPTTVILFYHVFHFENPISLQTLIDIGALSGAPQSIQEIDEKSYKEIMKRSGIDERFTVH